ncbi:MAG: type IV pilin [Thermoplasmata archaeon]|nr:type IV pilin [Thermoplasmata archaeon]
MRETAGGQNMKKIWKTRKSEEGVSPVIATILMVAITVVLAAVLYVMVINIDTNNELRTPLGLNQQSKNTTAVTLLVSSAPNNALVTGSTVSLLIDGTPRTVTNAIVYQAAIPIASYDGATATWTYSGGENADTATFSAGAAILVYSASGLTSGDSIIFSSTEGYFEQTPFDVN